MTKIEELLKLIKENLEYRAIKAVMEWEGK